jgi:hypothetical protein
MKMEQTQRSETLAFKLQTPGNHPEESIQERNEYKILTFNIKELLKWRFKFS